MVTFEISGYELRADRRYDRQTHMWVELLDGGRARLGMDPLGSETSGDVVALSLKPDGTAIRRGESFGDLEAAKFVGPLVSPLTGMLLGANPEVLADPGLLTADPTTHWLVEVALAEDAMQELDTMLQGEAEVGPWFAAAVERYRTQGAIAE